jgi:hypothetical protein
VARIAASTFDAGHAFPVAGVFPCNMENPLASHYVLPCDIDGERGGGEESGDAPH